MSQARAELSHCSVLITRRLALPLGLPLVDCLGLPGSDIADLAVRGWHLIAGYVSADSGGGYAEVGGHVFGGPPVLWEATGHLPQGTACQL